jgi:hypothetical protein
MMPCVIASPSPVPPSLVVKKGSKILSLFSSSIPFPVSLIVISIPLSGEINFEETDIVPPLSVASRALRIRLIRACCI